MSVCVLLHNHPCGLLLQGDTHKDPKRDLLSIHISSINSLYKEPKKQQSVLFAISLLSLTPAFITIH